MASKQEKLVFRIIFGISIFVFLLVLVLNRRVIPVFMETPSFVYYFPLLNACLNGTTFVLLFASLYFVKKKDIRNHKRLTLTAFFLSAIFIISYVTYHYFVPETSHGGEGFVKGFYYFILISHIIFATIVLPFILLSFYYGLQKNILKHKKIVKWAFPIWLYVTLTGVLVYLLISPYYSFPV